MKSYEFTGKTIEKAIEEGLKALNKNREDVDISILSEGGIFSKAKIKISVEEESPEDIAKEILREENFIDKKEQKNEEVEHCCDEENCDESIANENIDSCNCGDCCECNEPCECEESCECEDCCDDENLEANEEENTKERYYMPSEEVFAKIQEIFSNIFKFLNIDAKVMILENDDAYEVKIMGDEKVSSLIGFRGEGLNAYQFLINNFRDLRNKSKRILIDVENYRNRREESLRSLANRIAKKVVKTKKRYKFEPMSAFERHIIHEELASFEGITTHSEGVEPRRCLIVDIER